MSRQCVVVAVVVLAATGGANAAAEETDDAAPSSPAHSHGLVELKRQATGHGAPEETTKTNLKFDWFPRHDVVSLLRLEIPSPDEKTSFAGSLFDPDLGDAKVRVGSAPSNCRGGQ